MSLYTRPLRGILRGAGGGESKRREVAEVCWHVRVAGEHVRSRFRVAKVVCVQTTCKPERTGMLSLTWFPGAAFETNMALRLGARIALYVEFSPVFPVRHNS